jgi:hypothetical protein
MDCFASLVMTAPWLFENGSGNHSLVIPGLRQDGASRNDESYVEGARAHAGAQPAMNVREAR